MRRALCSLATLWVAALMTLVASPTLAALNCSGPARVLDPLGGPVTGDTRLSTNSADSYDCAFSAFGGPGLKAGFDGPEDVWQVTLANPSTASFVFTASNPEMRLMLLNSCDENACRSEGGCGENLAPATYYLVVDGANGAGGTYTIQPVLVQSAVVNRWYDCPECTASCSGTPDISSADFWQFNSSNYCGTGCDFAMYVVVGCGTEMHLPFFDPETGLVEISDVLRGASVELVATNVVPVNGPPLAGCELTDVGTQVGWQDRGCSAIPCPTANCGGGVDCKTNNKLIDVQMLGNPNLCGVYRVDLLDWGGWFWDLVSNCSADRTPQFQIYRDVCSALAAFHPRPEVGIANLSFDDIDCPIDRARGEITLENVGCVDVAGLELVIEQEPPLPPNPKVIPLNVRTVGPLTVKWDYDLTSAPARLRFRIDPSNQIAECSEDLGAPVSCGQGQILQRDIGVDVCSAECHSQADAGELQKTCDGSAVVLDGSASAINCKGSGAPQYRWEDTALSALPGCDWSPSPTCTVAAERLPPGKSRFVLRTRCGGASSGCGGVATTAVIVGGNDLPPRLVGPLFATGVGNDVHFEWSAVAGSGISVYRLFAGGDPQVNLAVRRLAAEVSAATSRGIDTGVRRDTSAPRLFYQVVAASCAGDLEGPY